MVDRQSAIVAEWVRLQSRLRRDEARSGYAGTANSAHGVLIGMTALTTRLSHTIFQYNSSATLVSKTVRESPQYGSDSACLDGAGNLPNRRSAGILVPRKARDGIYLARSAMKAYFNAVNFWRSKRPDSPECPAPMFTLNITEFLPVLCSRTLATHLAGEK